MGARWPGLPFPGDRELVLALLAWTRRGGEHERRGRSGV